MLTKNGSSNQHYQRLICIYRGGGQNNVNTSWKRIPIAAVSKSGAGLMNIKVEPCMGLYFLLFVFLFPLLLNFGQGARFGLVRTDICRAVSYGCNTHLNKKWKCLSQFVSFLR